jgi:hypothetical protein
MYLIFALFMSALAFISRGLTVSSSPSSAVYSSQVFVLGFVMAGRSFLPVGIEKDSQFLGYSLWVVYLILHCSINGKLIK